MTIIMRPGVYCSGLFKIFLHIHTYIVDKFTQVHSNMKYGFEVLLSLYADTVVKKSVMEGKAELGEFRWDRRPNKVKQR